MKILLAFLIIANVATPVNLSFLSNIFSSFGEVVRDNKSKLSHEIAQSRKSMLMNNMFSSMLLRGEPMNNQGNVFQMNVDGSRVPFNWTSCGPAGQLVEIKSLEVKPSPLSFPGTIAVAFDIFFNNNIGPNENITADLELYIMAGSSWLKIPCIGQMGSCTYLDLCSQLNQVTCPAELKEKGIPCHCPFSKGEYKLDQYKVEVDAEVFIQGSYKACVKLTSSDKGQIGCYEVYFTVE